MILAAILMACDSLKPPSPMQGRLKRVEMGAVNCEVEIDDGVTRTASWHLCPGKDQDASSLLGKSVTMTFDVAFVQSEGCAGKTNCMELVETVIVDTITLR